MFPVLRNDISVREQIDGALFQLPNSTYELRSPFEAFIILLFNGQRSLIDIASLLLHMKNNPKASDIEKGLFNFVEANRHIVDIKPAASQMMTSRPDPFAFLDKDDLFKRPTRCSWPLSVTWYLTRRCNLNCSYCFADAKYSIVDKLALDKDELSVDIIATIIHELQENGVTEVTLTGGEVTLRPDLIEIIRDLTAHGINADLATNACLIDEELAQRLSNAGLQKLQVKLDASTPLVQDRLARVKGIHSKLIDGIKLVASMGFSVSVACVLTSSNVNQAAAIYDLCNSLKVHNVSFRIYEPGIWALHGRGGDHLNLGPEAIIELVHEVDRIRANNKGSTSVQPVSISQFLKKPPTSVPSCAGMISTCTILENGVVSACEMLADFSDQFVFGNLNYSSLSDIWNSDKANNWVDRKNALQEPCLSCEALGKCKGGCPWKAMVAYGSWLCDPQCIKAPQPTAVRFSELP